MVRKKKKNFAAFGGKFFLGGGGHKAGARGGGPEIVPRGGVHNPDPLRAQVWKGGLSCFPPPADFRIRGGGGWGGFGAEGAGGVAAITRYGTGITLALLRRCIDEHCCSFRCCYLARIVLLSCLQ